MRDARDTSQGRGPLVEQSDDNHRGWSGHPYRKHRRSLTLCCGSEVGPSKAIGRSSICFDTSWRCASTTPIIELKTSCWSEAKMVRWRAQPSLCCHQPKLERDSGLPAPLILQGRNVRVVAGRRRSL